jgi:6,7-dimethyl-8-ribityllumazine synthase
MQVGLETGKPITFGLLTTYTDEQAILRSRKDEHNKGREAAAACLEALTVLRAIA